MKWLIVEDALRDRKGHWLEYVSTFVRGLTALGDEVVVLCDRKAEEFILEQTCAIPVLPESIWHRMGDGAGALKRYARVPWHAIATFLAVRKVFSAQFSEKEDLTTIKQSEIEHRRFPKKSERSESKDTTEPQGEAPDWIFVPTVLVHHLLGWWLLIKSGAVPKGARVLLFFPNLPIRVDDGGRASWNAGPTTKLLAWLFGQLRKEVEWGRVVLGVETHAMQRALESLIGMRVVYLPHPVEFHAEARRRGDFLLNTIDQREIDCRRQLRRSERSESKDTEGTEDQFVKKQVFACASQAGASESDSLASKLADSPVSASLNRSAIAPASALATSHLSPATSSSPIVFGCYGAARWEKGSDVFLESIKLILKNEVASGENQALPATNNPLLVTAAGRPIRFAIQWVEDFRDGKGNWVSMDPWLKNHPQVEVIGRYFQGAEYEQQLAKTDVMVLPYRSPYRLRVSRVVIEAMIHGMPVVATRGTTLFEQAEGYGVAIKCEEGSAESLARAILEVADEFVVMRETAEQKAKKAAESFSVGYFRKLLDVTTKDAK